MSNGPMTDQALVSNVLRGDRQAFILLIRQYERLVASMIRRVVKNDEECEELSQDVFIKVYDKLSEFNFESKLSTWIATIAYRHAINQYRKKKMLFQEMPDDSSMERQFIEQETPESVVGDEDMDNYIHRLIEMLPANYKIVLTLYHIEHFSYEEIAAATGMPEGTVKNYLFRARNLLKEKVKKYLEKEVWL